MFTLTWLTADGYLFAVTSPQKRALWNLRFHLSRTNTGVKPRLWDKSGKLIDFMGRTI